MTTPSCPDCRLPLAPRLVERPTGDGRRWASHAVALVCPRCGGRAR